MSISLNDFEVVAENGAKVTGRMIEEWEAAYSDGRLPDGYTFEEQSHRGEPKAHEDEMDTLIIKIPHSQKEALETEAKKRGMSTSLYVRELIEAQSA